ncbi:hypothetical protein LIER_24871 [Lithospermum erythrorhizon]|uniref:Uncharacterized protein n=1 Tax=Lithospermum erythrorhizon TaxID=34254 RepID=A0AAV3R2U4_LITER
MFKASRAKDVNKLNPKWERPTGYARSSSSHQVSPSLDALAGSGSLVPLQATPLASRAALSSRHPPQAKTGSEFFDGRPPALAPKQVMVSSSSEEDGTMSSLLRMYLPLPGLSFFVEPLVASILTWAACHRPRLAHGETYALGPQDALPEPQGMRINTSPGSEGNLSSPSPPSLLGQSQSPLPTANQALGDAPVNASGQHSTTVVLDRDNLSGVGIVTPQTPSSVLLQASELHAMGQSMSPPRSSLPPRKGMGTSLVSPRPSQSLRRSEKTPPPPSPNHTELISSFSALGDKLEGELRALKKENPCEEGVLQRRLKNLVGEHITLQEKYAASVRRTEAVRAELEGVPAKRESAMKSIESQRQVQIMEATLEGTRTTEGLGELVRSSDAEHELLFQHSSLALDRAIRAVQPKLEKAELEVPASLWDSMRDDVSSPHPSNL